MRRQAARAAALLLCLALAHASYVQLDVCNIQGSEAAPSIAFHYDQVRGTSQRRELYQLYLFTQLASQYIIVALSIIKPRRQQHPPPPAGSVQPQPQQHPPALWHQALLPPIRSTQAVCHQFSHAAHQQAPTSTAPPALRYATWPTPLWHARALPTTPMPHHPSGHMHLHPIRSHHHHLNNQLLLPMLTLPQC